MLLDSNVGVQDQRVGVEEEEADQLGTAKACFSPDGVETRASIVGRVGKGPCHP